MSEFVKKTNGSIISTNSVRKLYGEFVAVDDLTFMVGHGETYGLLGPIVALIRPFMALITGLIGGSLVHIFDNQYSCNIPF